jgi:zinc protease
MKEISEYYDGGIRLDELEFMKSSIGQREALSYESPFQKADFLRRIMTYDLSEDFTVQQNEILQEITKKEIDDLARKYLSPDRMKILVVGDKKTIQNGLGKLDYEIIQLDMEGNEIINPEEKSLNPKK